MRESSKKKKKGKEMLMGSRSVGVELQQLDKERAIQTDPRETQRRRTILLARPDTSVSWGFTLQTYGIRHKQTGQLEVLTYVDYVEFQGPACIAGMRKGDVFLSVNGESVEGLNHNQLVAKIQETTDSLRLVVLFEDCCRKVELYERFIKLKRLHAFKKREFKQLEHEEKILLSGGMLSRVGLSRDSLRSSTSSDWDCYSELGLAAVLEDPVTPNQHNVVIRSSPTLHPPTHPPHRHSGHLSSPLLSRFVVSLEPSLLEDSSSDTSVEKTCTADGEADQVDGSVPGDDTKDNVSLTTKHDTVCSGDGDASDSQTPESDQAKDSDIEDEPPPGARKRSRSNSTILIEMRMKLIADIVSTEASAAVRLLEEDSGDDVEQGERGGDGGSDEGGDGGALSDSEVIVEVEEEKEGEGNSVYRVCRGVRVNDRTQITRL